MLLFWKQVLQSLVFGSILPAILFSRAEKVIPEVTQIPPSAQDQIWIPVIGEEGRVVAMELEDYVCRVVLGEMPAGFDPEALKSQAVAARTYTLRMVGQGDRHDGAVCTDYTCCQEYRDPEDYLEAGGTQASIDKIRDAVEQTRGQVLYHEDELILATYFACSGGRTEDAEDVWGAPYPYLQSVPSPERTDYDDDMVEVSFEAFCGAVGSIPEGAPESWIGETVRTEGGGVASIWIGNREWSGVEIRSLFGLRSTDFTVETKEDGFVFRTKGYGHRVGLSQYGADALAKEGFGYEEILAHYYTDTTLCTYRND